MPIDGLEKMIELSGTDGSRELLLRSMGTGSSMPAVSTTQNASANALDHHTTPLVLSSSSVAMGLTSSIGGASAPLCRNTTASIQYKARGEEAFSLSDQRREGYSVGALPPRNR